MPTANRIFQSSAKFMHSKIKKKSDTFAYAFNRNHCFKYSFKSCFQEAFLVKVIYTENRLHALNHLIPRGNKRSHLLKQTYSS